MCLHNHTAINCYSQIVTDNSVTGSLYLLHLRCQRKNSTVLTSYSCSRFSFHCQPWEAYYQELLTSVGNASLEESKWYSIRKYDERILRVEYPELLNPLKFIAKVKPLEYIKQASFTPLFFSCNGMYGSSHLTDTFHKSTCLVHYTFLL